MINSNNSDDELLFERLYSDTQIFGRVEFVKALFKKELEINKLRYQLKCIKEYVNFNIDCYNSDIKDLKDDISIDSMRIDNLKEDKSHYEDILKLCNNEFDLYLTCFPFVKK